MPPTAYLRSSYCRNLYAAPPCKPSYESNITGTYVVGDLHANAIRLLYFLIHFGYVECNQKLYDQLVTAYQNKDLLQFERYLNEVQVSPQTGTRLILIGDTLCDRGKSDYMILNVYALLAKAEVDFNIILSNHDLDFLNQYASDFRPGEDFSLSDPTQRCSYESELLMIPLYKEKIKLWVKHVYLPRLKIFSYDTIQDAGNSGVIIYSHAPLDLKLLFRCAKFLHIQNPLLSGTTGDQFAERTQTDTQYQILSMIDDINRSFADKVESNPKYHLSTKFMEQSYLFDLVWQRESSYFIRPSKNPVVQLMNVFGHVGSHFRAPQNTTMLVNLDDSSLGKYNCAADNLIYFDLPKAVIRSINLFLRPVSPTVSYQNTLPRVPSIPAFDAAHPFGVIENPDALLHFPHTTIQSIDHSIPDSVEMETVQSPVTRSPHIQNYLLQTAYPITDWEASVRLINWKLALEQYQKDIWFKKSNTSDFLKNAEKFLNFSGTTTPIQTLNSLEFELKKFTRLKFDAQSYSTSDLLDVLVKYSAIKPNEVGIESSEQNTGGCRPKLVNAYRLSRAGALPQNVALL